MAPAVHPRPERETLPLLAGRQGMRPTQGLKQNLFLYAAGRLMAGLVLRPFFRLAIDGAVNLPRKGGYVLLPKHQRWEDIPLLGLACPHPLYYVAKHELFATGLSSWFLKSLGGVPLNRQNPLKTKGYLRDLIRVVADGNPVALFPEGTYYPDTLGPGQTGLVRFILKRYSPVFVPVGISYSGGRTACEVSIRFGRVGRIHTAEPVDGFMDRMMQQIGSLSGLT